MALLRCWWRTGARSGRAPSCSSSRKKGSAPTRARSRAVAQKSARENPSRTRACGTFAAAHPPAHRSATGQCIRAASESFATPRTVERRARSPSARATPPRNDYLLDARPASCAETPKRSQRVPPTSSPARAELHRLAPTPNRRARPLAARRKPCAACSRTRPIPPCAPAWLPFSYLPHLHHPLLLQPPRCLQTHVSQAG
mmetsp:Transcript_49429/g.131215  ORF Transcript_49429/g.131215 Transcript_49429/m.131215 type:complete len:200 (+) Transcript_49429:879-1478(+)